MIRSGEGLDGFERAALDDYFHQGRLFSLASLASLERLATASRSAIPTGAGLRTAT